MTRSAGSGKAWATASAIVAVVALLTGVYVLHRLLSLPEQMVETGRKVSAELRDLAAAFHRGSVETAFFDYATELSATTKLQVAELRRLEVYTRTESSSVLWGALRLPDVIVEARVPVEYVYTLDLAKTWQFALEDRQLMVRAPGLEFNSPALDVSHLEYEVRAASILRDEDAAIGALQSGLTELSRERARESIALVRETARRQTEDFIRTWLGATFDGGADYRIEVSFEGEPAPGERATLVSPLEGAR